MVQLNITENDFIHEEEILRNPHSVKSWLRYIEHKQEEGDFGALNMIYERALKQLPGSYKLWYKAELIFFTVNSRLLRIPLEYIDSICS